MIFLVDIATSEYRVFSFAVVRAENAEDAARRAAEKSDANTTHAFLDNATGAVPIRFDDDGVSQIIKILI